MNTETGEIRDIRELEPLAPEERKKWIPLKRDLSLKEQLEKRVELYSPCGCGSGESFKFCCYRKP